jgi:hypothetical protein
VALKKFRRPDPQYEVLDDISNNEQVPKEAPLEEEQKKSEPVVKFAEPLE